MCVFVVINILHEVSMSFLFYSSVAFNFTTYHKNKKTEKNKKRRISVRNKKKKKQLNIQKVN